jgi:hypothetical protein
MPPLPEVNNLPGKAELAEFATRGTVRPSGCWGFSLSRAVEDSADRGPESG